MNRREMISTTAMAGAGFIIGTGFTAPACPGAKNLSTYVQMLAGGFSEIKSLLPTLGLSQSTIDKVADLIDKGVKIAKDFDAAYRAGKFSDAATLFTNLGSMISQVISTLGLSVENKAVKVALAAIGIARVAIAILLQREAVAQSQVMAGVLQTRSAAEVQAIGEIQKLAETDLTPLLKALLP